MYEQELRQRLSWLAIELLDFADELRRADLVGDVRVELCVIPRCVPVQRLRHRRIGEVSRAGRFQTFAFVHAGQFVALAEIAECDAMPVQVMPQRAGLELIFRMHG